MGRFISTNARVIFVLFTIAFAAQSGAQEGAINRDSLAVLLAEVPVDMLAAKMGDSLFHPQRVRRVFCAILMASPHLWTHR